jgi:ubiquitin-protein ligase
VRILHPCRVDSSQTHVLKALILAPNDTPYANAAFVFDILLPNNYPAVTPKVQLLTTGGGSVRFNPNL